MAWYTQQYKISTLQSLTMPPSWHFDFSEVPFNYLHNFLIFIVSNHTNSFIIFYSILPVSEMAPFRSLKTRQRGFISNVTLAVRCCRQVRPFYLGELTRVNVGSAKYSIYRSEPNLPQTVRSGRNVSNTTDTAVNRFTPKISIVVSS